MEDLTGQNVITEKINTGVEGTNEDDSIQITLPALLEIKKTREENDIPDEFYLRLATQSGGCAGMQYALGFDDNINENDRLFEKDNYKIVIDSRSLFYFMGITLDFIDDPINKGFTFRGINNVSTCGCSGH